MTDIKELAAHIARDMWGPEAVVQEAQDFAQRFLAAYLAEQEPVWYHSVDRHGVNHFTGPDEDCAYGAKPLYTAPPLPEAARNLYREIYEVWAGSEGIPMPRTAPEAYLLQLLEQMVDIAKTGMNMTEPAPQQETIMPGRYKGDALCAAPSSEEVREMVERLRNDETDLFRLQEKAADLIERLAARVPDGCVVVPREPTEAMCQAASARCHHPQALYKTAYKAMIAAGEMKP